MDIEDIIKAKIQSNSREGVSYIHPIKEDQVIASYVSAYANGKGGVLVFGVRDDGSDLHVKQSAFNISEKEAKIQSLLSSSVELDFGALLYEPNNKLEYILVNPSLNKIEVDGVRYVMNENQKPVPIEVKTVFLSYSHKDACIADSIEEGLNSCTRNINIYRDIRDVKYKESFSEFMNTINEHDFVISIVSDNYLKSRNCMYEVVEVMKDKKYIDKLLYIIIGDKDLSVLGSEGYGSAAKIYTMDGQDEYIKYWQCQEEEIKKLTNGIDLSNTKNYVEELQVIRRIQLDIQNFMAELRDRKGLSYSEILSSGFRDILSVIGE